MGGRRKMLLASGLVLVIVALLSVPTLAECPNACSGNGACMAKDMCNCYKNYEGNDCFDRTCQFGYAHADTPKGDINMDQLRNTPGWILQDSQQFPAQAYEYFSPDAAQNEAHFYMECSNKGLCDRSLGSCTCFDGYEGVACQRAACPNKCSGHGTCESISELGLKAPGTLFGNPDNVNKITYDLWDSKVTYGCRCDPWYHGADCSLRTCKVGVDPMFLSVGSATYETFGLHLWLDPTAFPTSATVSGVTSPVVGLSKLIGLLVAPTALQLAQTNAAAVAAAIKKIPNQTFQNVDCEPTNDNVGYDLVGYKSTRPLITHGLSVVCQFNGNPGRLRAPEIVSYNFNGVVDPALQFAALYTMEKGQDNEWFTEDSGVVISGQTTTTLSVTNTASPQSDVSPTLFRVGSHVLLGTLSGSTITLSFPVNHALGTTNHRFNAQKDSSGVSRVTVSTGKAILPAVPVGATTITVTGAATGLAAGDLIFFENQFYRLKSVVVATDTVITLDRPFGGNSLNGGANTILFVYEITPPDDAYKYNYASQCSGRGICDTETGVCDCFKGYTNDNCDTQNILAL
ncbi:EGF-like domain, extracellular [Phytophthora cactorum]|nr:EGF-like domain, extracellular [Phytophthora cactorum]